ncbi:hypothetical protein G9A89_017087 [Geosiphon pyriformis]|nr:hypothetical protein G9A89_017087 [Geosiphon pyriformis]
MAEPSNFNWRFGPRPVTPTSNQANWSPGGGGSSSNAYSSFSFSSWSEAPNKNQSLDAKRDVTRNFVRIKFNNYLNALSASPDRTVVVLAGHQVLKTLKISDKKITEELNLKTRESNNKQSNNDVKWGKQYSHNKIATASNNGYILIWDVGSGKGLLASSFCPSRLDHTNDIRDRDRSKVTFDGKSESVRDVQFHPSNGNEFVAAFDNGTIQKWDIRKPSMCEKRFFGHTGSVLALDWHSDGHKLASGGRDKNIKIWDMNSENRQAPEIVLVSCIAPVARIKWRPNHPDEIASCSFSNDNRIFIWNLKRPYISSYFFDEHEDSPTGILWDDANVLWSCSKDKSFIQQDIRVKSYRQLDLLNKNAIGWNVYDEIAFTIDKPATVSDDHRATPTNNQFRRMQRRPSPAINDIVMEADIRNHPKTGVACLMTFDYESFRYLAENYIISSEDIWNTCEHNARVAWEAQKYRSSQTWKIIQLLYGKGASFKISSPESENLKLTETTAPDLSLNRSSKSSKESELQENSSKLKEKGIDHSQENEDSLSESEESDVFVPDEPRGKEIVLEAALQPASNFIKMTTKVVQPTLRLAVRPVWNHEPIMDSLLHYYAEQGDVQMCVILVNTLDQRIKVSEDLIKEWTFSYIELLQRFQLWTSAAAVINSSKIPLVRVQNQESTTIYMICNNCSKLILNSNNGFSRCEKCQKLLTSCSICHQIVKALQNVLQDVVIVAELTERFSTVSQ